VAVVAIPFTRSSVLILTHLAGVSTVRHMNVRQLCAPDTVVSTGIVPMQDGWKFARVVDSIANAVNADTDYVRFYTSASVRHPTPRDEPARSITKMCWSECRQSTSGPQTKCGTKC
jgi:hypothetical protein